MPRHLSLLGVVSVAVTAATLFTSGAAAAATPALSNPHEIAHFNVAAGQSPENLTVKPNGSADVTLVFSRQIANVTPDGHTTIRATLPPPDAPPVGRVGVAGIVGTPFGTDYVAYHSGTVNQNGIWALSPFGGLRRVAALPVTVTINGMALDPRSGVLYGTDSSQGTIWRIPLFGGTPTIWSSDAALRPSTAPTSTGFGANGLKVHNGAVWVSNTDNGTLLRFPMQRDGSAGAPQVKAANLAGIDDFSFLGSSDTILAALLTQNAVALIKPDGTHTIVLTQQDGLENPTATAISGGTVYVTSAAYFTQHDPNVLLAKINLQQP